MGLISCHLPYRGVVLTVLWTIIAAVWTILPAYVPNSAAVVTGGGPPIDGGRTWAGCRVLGDGKTWRGAFGGTAAGVVMAFLLNFFRSSAFPIVGARVPVFPVQAAVALPLGAICGDIVASFIKRRMGHERGAAVPLLDQLDFLAGALALAYIVAPGWAAEWLGRLTVAVLVVLTPLFHRMANQIGYRIGLKDEPW
ncbi:MAG: CDP-2,3-bis-(O-geranylgeranyl)-sn-glycerol synthase [Candidatus Nanohaloarchaea archaeon]|nr:CDP-2,3-bis-(O-geranylgeranyl)-sn-glycerol synthase [Candidatus Nanohaloarchaea archaeon]